MVLSNSDVIETIQFLDSFATKRLPQKISYAILKNVNILMKEYNIYQEAFQRLVNYYGDDIEIAEDGNYMMDETGMFVFKENADEHFKNFQIELNELLSAENDIDFYCVKERYFDYDDMSNKYDVLTAVEISDLSKILTKMEEE